MQNPSESEEKKQKKKIRIKELRFSIFIHFNYLLDKDFLRKMQEKSVNRETSANNS